MRKGSVETQSPWGGRRLGLATHCVVTVMRGTLWFSGCAHSAWDLKSSSFFTRIPPSRKYLVNQGALTYEMLELFLCLIPKEYFGLA